MTTLRCPYCGADESWCKNPTFWSRGMDYIHVSFQCEKCEQYLMTRYRFEKTIMIGDKQ